MQRLEAEESIKIDSQGKMVVMVVVEGRQQSIADGGKESVL